MVQPAQDLADVCIGIIGLGYVGLPLAVEFGKQYSCVGFDVSTQRIEQLRNGLDTTLEVDNNELKQATKLTYTNNLDALRQCSIFIVTVPTPIDKYKRPDLTPLRRASETIAKVIKPGDLVIYESTVFPGATEEVCIPLIEQASGLQYNQDFWAGYSPERINPGDKEHRVTNIIKVTSGSTPEVADLVDQLYGSIITAGTYKASTIKVAEAAKVIENTQRDLNIALVNELALIFERLEVDTLDVLEAAGTKWNFLPFKPGLVGGHCIGVDPYYLTFKAQEIGYNPEVILAGRRINDEMGANIANRMVRLLAQKRINLVDAKVLVLGLAFKENCPDIRNTKVVDVINELEAYNLAVDVYDPWIEAKEAEHEYGITPVEQPVPGTYDAVLLAVAHNQFVEMGADGVLALCKPNHVIFDVKNALPRSVVTSRL